MIQRTVAVLLVALVVLSGTAGCKSGAADSTQTGVPTGTPVATSSVEPTVTGDSSTTEDASQVSGSTSAKSADTAAIEKELAAIEKELDALSMPSDSDFDAIEGDLP